MPIDERPPEEEPPAPENPFDGDASSQPALAGSVEDEDDYRNLLIDEIRQRMRVRTIALWAAGIMLTFLTAYASVGLWRIAFVDASRLLPWQRIAPSTAIVLVVSPIVSISTIIVMILLGAFRRFKDEDMDRVDFRSLLAEAIKTIPK